MAYQIVRAFEEHDRKRYQRCARAFGEVYTYLFPVEPVTAHSAGSGYASALKNHDAIEDGVKAVVGHEPITTEYIEDDMELPQRAREILSHPYWNTVLFGFELVVDALDLPHQYAEEQTAFFRYHTAAHEARDRAPAMHRDLGQIAMAHAKRAQKSKFGVFVDDEETLDRIAEIYLAAVRSHDAHTAADQEANISRMISIYDRVLAGVVCVESIVWRVPNIDESGQPDRVADAG